MQEGVEKFEETFDSKKTEIIEDSQSLIQIQEETKSSIDVLRKMRHNFEMFFKCQKQLIHEKHMVGMIFSFHMHLMQLYK